MLVEGLTPDNSNEEVAQENSRILRAAVEKVDGKDELFIPAGIYYSTSWGPDVGGRPWRNTGLRGTGRTSQLVHVHYTGKPFIGFRGQGDIWDTRFRDIGLRSYVDQPILKLHGYSVLLDNVWVRGYQDAPTPKQVGIWIAEGQHYTLNHCQVEFCSVGVRVDQPFGVVANHLNVEYSVKTGLMVVGGRRASTCMIVNGLYSERNNQAVRAQDTSVNLLGLAGGGRVTLHNCNSSVIDLGQSSYADVELTGPTNGCKTVLPLIEPSKVHYRDESSGCNSFCYGVVGSSGYCPSVRKVTVTSNYHREGVIRRIQSDQSLRFRVRFATQLFMPFFVAFWDKKNRESYDFESRRWTGSALRPSCQVPYESGQPTAFEATLEAEGKEREVVCQLIITGSEGGEFVILDEPSAEIL